MGWLASVGALPDDHAGALALVGGHVVFLLVQGGIQPGLCGQLRLTNRHIIEAQPVAHGGHFLRVGIE